jgi:hypothetical protein
MGIFDFVKGAGSQLFGGKAPADNKETYKPLSAHVEEHGISAKNITFRFEQGTLVVEGVVPDQTTREKVILIVGNVQGISKVDDRLQVGAAPARGAAPRGMPPVFSAPFESRGRPFLGECRGTVGVVEAMAAPDSGKTRGQSPSPPRK